MVSHHGLFPLNDARLDELLGICIYTSQNHDEMVARRTWHTQRVHSCWQCLFDASGCSERTRQQCYSHYVPFPQIFISIKAILFSLLSVGWLGCLFAALYKKYWIYIQSLSCKTLWEDVNEPRKNPLRFGADPDKWVDHAILIKLGIVGSMRSTECHSMFVGFWF